MAETYYYGSIGNLNTGIEAPVERKYTIIQSLWTKPITDKTRLRDTMFIAALSLAFAHRNGYKVHMHTDSKGVELMKNFGYEKLLPTLDKIPDSVPIDLFAAGKFYALQEEGVLGKIHIDIDVFIKKPYLLNKFYEDKTIDVIGQTEEPYDELDYLDHLMPHIFTIGYPAETRPSWRGCINTGTIGFNNRELASKYMSNYFNALKIYTADKFAKYRETHPNAWLGFDFILEQINLSYLSVGYNVYTLLPTKNPSGVADEIGYQHYQGGAKWKEENLTNMKRWLRKLDNRLYIVALAASRNALR